MTGVSWNQTQGGPRCKTNLVSDLSAGTDPAGHIAPVRIPPISGAFQICQPARSCFCQRSIEPSSRGVNECAQFKTSGFSVRYDRNKSASTNSVSDGPASTASDTYQHLAMELGSHRAGLDRRRGMLMGNLPDAVLPLRDPRQAILH